VPFFVLSGKRHIQLHSLLTKNSQEARTLALKFNLNIEERRMNIEKFSNSLRHHPDRSIEADLKLIGSTFSAFFVKLNDAVWILLFLTK
jgi:hypothetical protein